MFKGRVKQYKEVMYDMKQRINDWLRGHNSEEI
jgi:hypothetical protein